MHKRHIITNIVELKKTEVLACKKASSIM